MTARILGAFAGFVLACAAAGLASAAPSDYVLELATQEVAKGDATEIAVRLVHKSNGQPVPGAIVVRTSLDMSPDNMAGMQAKLESTPSTEPGLFRFKTKLAMAGRWALKLAATVPGETETVETSLIVTAKDVASGADAKPAARGERKLLYYRNPMGLPDTSPVPKKDWMGMDYIPVYEGEAEAGASVSISLDRVQRSGVRTEAATMRKIDQHVRAPGIAKPDERSLRVVSLRSDGFIEKLYVNETGRHIKAGDPLFRVYSPQVVSAQVDFRTTAATGRGPGDEKSAVQRLKNLDVPPALIQQLEEGHGPILSFDWPAPVGGYIMEKNVVEGQMAKAGDPLMRIAGLDPVWVICDVPEQDIALVRDGAVANVGFRAFPNRLFEGRVTFILHELDAKTRTAKVRVELANPDHAIRHEMFADVEILADGSEQPRLAVPASAVIDTGSRQVVLVGRGEGKFEPRNVKLGVSGDGLVEITDGVKEGEDVVVSANFLIDAESNIRSALKAFTADSGAQSDAGAPVAPPQEHQHEEAR